MSWDKFTAWIDQFTNKPLVYGLFIVLVSFGCAFILFSQTSVGKKTLNKLTKLYELSHQNSSKTLKKVEQVETFTKEQIKALESDYEQKFNDYKNECELRVSTVISFFNYNEEKLFAILEKVPNAKVQEELKEFKLGYEEKKQEISGVIGLIYQDYEASINQAKEEVYKEYNEKINFLEDKIKELNLYLSEIKKEEESNNGQGEETINSNTTKEALQKNSEDLWLGPMAKFNRSFYNHWAC